LIATYPNTELESLTFDRDSGTYRAEFDQNRTSASAAVTALLSAVRDCGPTEFAPLYESVDPDALDSFFVSTASGTNRTGLTTFAYSDCEVTVSADGVVLVDPFTSDASN